MPFGKLGSERMPLTIRLLKNESLLAVGGEHVTARPLHWWFSILLYILPSLEHSDVHTIKTSLTVRSRND